MTNARTSRRNTASLPVWLAITLALGFVVACSKSPEGTWRGVEERGGKNEWELSVKKAGDAWDGTLRIKPAGGEQTEQKLEEVLVGESEVSFRFGELRCKGSVSGFTGGDMEGSCQQIGTEASKFKLARK